MKNLQKNAFIILLIAIMFVSCQPENVKDLGIERDLITSLNGTWKLNKAIQVDEDAAKKGFPYQQMDITGLFPYADFVLTLNVNAGTPTTFTSVLGGSPNIVRLRSGTWTVDDLKYPKNIYMVSGTATDTVSLGGYPVGAATTLKLKKEKRDFTSGKLLISYSYEFVKQ